MSSSQRKQQTLSAPAEFRGKGYWSGAAVRLEFRPAPADTGIVFVRRDLPGQPRIPATADYRTETPLRTVLFRGGACVEMVEHVMAALAGMQIDNCEIWSDAPEMPAADGSCLPLVETLTAAGRAEQDAPRPQRVVRRVVRCGNRESWVEARPENSGKMVLAYELDYGSGNPIGRQSLEITLSPRYFCRSLAPSRTFLLEAEALALQAQGLGRHVTHQDLLVFGPQGPIDNPLRFPDECVRHKMVDMVGDLALAGCDLIGRFVAFRSGHRLNAELVRRLLAVEEQHPADPLRRCA
ncbi:MAG: UDP-3-O-[3-hydroxymyristoyl] N-acetylglucosamine deacetylase [Pirellulales bacterium]|nr:UDP-3-O-[3-hydroxymyristoyl] N-acetylglucosamine deacetylase [Pirellulales bacterium]